MYTHLLAVLAVPDVDSAVAGAGDDELRVRGEGGLQGELLGVQVTCRGQCETGEWYVSCIFTCECLKRCSII